MKRKRLGGPSSSGARVGGHTQTFDPTARLHSIFESGFPYSKKLLAHRSCVNAITFSKGEGRWLASAGDDLRVLLWDLHQEDVRAPSCSLTGHRSNIFCLDFSAQNQFVYSGSTDEKILKYDISTASSSSSGTPIQTFSTHEDNVRGLSCHPENEDMFLSAGEDGVIALHDSRAVNGCAGSVMNDCEVTDVRFHPRADKLFFTADTHGNVCLRDTRMAFADRTSAGSNGVSVAGGKGTVMKYATAILRRSVPYMVQPEAASLAIDRSGTKFAVTFLHHLPTIYSTADPIPLAVCSGKNFPNGSPVPEGESSYRNTCTIKHGAFGGPAGDTEDAYFTTGSDDFRAYVWKIPNLAGLREERRVLDESEFQTESPRLIGYAQNTDDNYIYIPADICTPLFRLQGHDSIINSSIIHPHMPQIATCGVERHITIHSPTPTAPNMSFIRTREEVRVPPRDDPQTTRRFLQALLAGHNIHVNGSEDGESEERNTIDFFDGVIREHEDVNVFTAGWKLGGRDGDMDVALDSD
ncbi:WD40 repeat-like protein [Fomitiporia mediterranea MF3/22]|uniref:WD40 repeat-like protein n=1 Tax=Fomitiporia mediterranea (strain MF3/22) TaxID=694068 RepID=UPI00044088BD|nr:WD40 repeat-like protein [Fomitiporia mediterranea MF3/22]EJC98064.1 WD40 repeat-like protein [Fomitiporia mediterranea MF3/22]